MVEQCITEWATLYKYIWNKNKKNKKHGDVIKWKHFPRYWPFVRGIHRSPVNFLHKGQWRGALMFSLICNWTNSWKNNGDTLDLRRNRAHSDVIVMDQVYRRIHASLAPDELTHCGWVTHICVGNLTIIGSDDGLLPSRPQTIKWTNAEIL